MWNHVVLSIHNMIEPAPVYSRVLPLCLSWCHDKEQYKLLQKLQELARTLDPSHTDCGYHHRFYCPACRTTLIATRFRVAVICPIIQVPHCIRVFFYFVWFVFINHIFQFHNEFCTYCNILDIYLSQNLNFVNYVLFYMKLLNYLFFSMFGSVLESRELTGVCLLLPWLIKWK